MNRRIFYPIHQIALPPLSPAEQEAYDARQAAADEVIKNMTIYESACTSEEVSQTDRAGEQGYEVGLVHPVGKSTERS